jgi:hypothetical protein
LAAARWRRRGGRWVPARANRAPQRRSRSARSRISSSASSTPFCASSPRTHSGGAGSAIGALDAEVGRSRQRLAAGRAAQVEVLRAEAERASAAADRVRFRGVARLSPNASWGASHGHATEATRATQLVAGGARRHDAAGSSEAVALARMANPRLQEAAARAEAAAASARIARSASLAAAARLRQLRRWADDEGDDASNERGLRVDLALFTGGSVRRASSARGDEPRPPWNPPGVPICKCNSDVDQAMARSSKRAPAFRDLTHRVDRFAEVTRIRAAGARRRLRHPDRLLECRGRSAADRAPGSPKRAIPKRAPGGARERIGTNSTARGSRARWRIDHERASGVCSIVLVLLALCLFPVEIAAWRATIARSIRHRRSHRSPARLPR